MRRTLEEAISDGRGFYVVSGMGDDSAKMIAQLYFRGLEPKEIIFCDTQDEWPHTYKFIAYLSRWMMERGWSKLTILNKKNASGDTIGVYHDNFKNGRMPPVVYGYKTCSQKFKIEVADRHIAIQEGHQKKNGKVSWKDWDDHPVKCVGINADEHHRMPGWNENNCIEQVYPLDDWGIGEDGGENVVKKVGLYLPGKSSCFMCPNTKAEEVVELYKKHPLMFYRAIAMEENVKLQGNDVTETDYFVFTDEVSGSEFAVKAKKVKGVPDEEATIKSIKNKVKEQLGLISSEDQFDLFGKPQIVITQEKRMVPTQFVGLGRSKSWMEVIKYWQMTGQIDAFSDMGGEMCANGGCGT